MACNPGAEEVGTGGFLELADKPSWISKFQTHERFMVRTPGGSEEWYPKNGTWSLVSTCSPMHTQTCIPTSSLKHMYMHRKRSSNQVRTQSARWGLKRQCSFQLCVPWNRRDNNFPQTHLTHHFIFIMQDDFAQDSTHFPLRLLLWPRPRLPAFLKHFSFLF